MRSHRRHMGRAMVLGAIFAFTQLNIGIVSVAAHGECIEGQQSFDADCMENNGETLEAFVEGPISAQGDPVGPAVSTFTYSPNMTPIGYSARNVPTTGTQSYNSDLAFWGNYAFTGHYDGFRIIDISNPANPNVVSSVTGCGGGTGQGDIVVWENLLVRSWDAAATGTCGGMSSGTGFEGINFFDISNKAAPQFLGNLPMVATQLANQLVIDAGSTAARPHNKYQASGAAFGPALNPTGVSGSIVLGHDGVGTDTDGCSPLVGFPAGSIALFDLSATTLCALPVRAKNAQDAGAIAVIIARNDGNAAATMAGTDPTITISSIQITQANGVILKAGLPATGTVRQNTQPTLCGSHTNTILPDVARGNLYMIVGASSTSCAGLDIVRVPINNPYYGAEYVRREPSGRACHDNTVDMAHNRIICAGGNGFTVWSFDPSLPPSAVGGIEDPIQVRSTSVSGVSIAHSSTITPDGKVMVFGHEPGGGSGAQCQASTSVVNKSLFFYNLASGSLLGTFVQPRPQNAQENCTWHNFNPIQTNRGYGLVVGSYQMGITVIDFTDPTNASQVAFADPAPLSTSGITLGGDWSTYWYNGKLYENDIRRGLIIWDLNHRLNSGTATLAHSNPQTILGDIQLDATAPVTTASLAPAPVNGWYATNPTVTLSATDSGPEVSGVDFTEYNLDGGGWTTYSGPFVVSGDGPHSLDYRSKDFALNLEATNTTTFDVDVTAPVVTLTEPQVAATQVAGAAGNYALGSVQNADYSCADATSGVASCVGTVANGAAFDTSTVGFHSFTVTAVDNAGHTTVVTHQYNVYWPGWGDFRQPIDLGILNIAKAGSAIPVKFSLGGNMGLGIFAAGYPQSQPVACDGSLAIDPIEETVNAGGSSLSFGSSQYVYVWKTEASWAGTCRVLRVKLIDNTVHTALFKFK